MNHALVFDCDGVLADTERFGHLPAFNQMFREFGVPVQWTAEQYGEKLKIGGGKERMMSLLTPEFATAAGLPTDPDEQRTLVGRWHARKTEIYTNMVTAGKLPGRPGVRRLAAAAVAAGWKLAVASTSAEPSVRAVLEHVVGPSSAGSFLVLAGDVVPRKKPAPDIYLLALQRLGVPASATLVIEDSKNGVDAAAAAGIRCLVTVSDYTRGEDFAAAELVVSSLGDPGGEQTQILSNVANVTVDGWVDLQTLESLLTAAK